VPISAHRAAQHVALSVLALASLVVAGLPGTTSAAPLPAPARAAIDERPPPGPAALLDASFPPALPVTDGVLREHEPKLVPHRPPSYFAHAQVVSVYGHPGFPVMGELGAHDPDGAVAHAKALARQYDALNGPRDVIAALHLIVDVAQASPQSDRSYLAQMPLERIDEYVEVARRTGVLLFIDLQIGWADPLATVERVRHLLREPFVHLALDPEFATRGRGAAPGVVIGTLDAVDINRVQRSLAELVRAHELPPKILVIHQFLVEMISNAHAIERLPEVEVTIDMDGFGPPPPKIGGYQRYAMAEYAERAAIKLFYHWDLPLMTPEDVIALPRIPDYVIYQ